MNVFGLGIPVNCECLGKISVIMRLLLQYVEMTTARQELYTCI